jgi:hypothetical protein
MAKAWPFDLRRRVAQCVHVADVARDVLQHERYLADVVRFKRLAPGVFGEPLQMLGIRFDLEGSRTTTV